MSDNFQNAVAIIAKQEEKFIKLVESSKTDVMFKNELLFASQAMMNNDYLCKCATTNPLSLRNAFSQVAAYGLTLNQSRQLAYLVPRDGQVVLDVSWRGMVWVAVNDGAIRDCFVELVYSNDKFEYRGKRQSPIHTFNPFDKKADRGEFVGCYVEASLPDGRVHVEAVTADDIKAARDSSDLWKRKKKGPWVDFEDSMRKKSAIKIARKYWPQTGAKLDGVIQYLNKDAGEGFSSNDVPVEVVERYMGAANVVEPEPLPTSNQVDQEPAPAAQPEQAANPEVADPAPADDVIEGEVVRDGSQVPPPADLPKKTINKVAEVVRRARAANCWEPAFEYVSTWPVVARDYAVTQLKSAQYVAQSQGE
ncbi:recombinase RecT [Pseudomonas lundensis]|uniref:recombinase RecT n=1 Tax=Pseudomonas lundensis TaxID=86185 RepID=UPI001473D8FD|nr:recombinase RecT [Pseudomonas lundensis]NNA12927.1 recombinase RecT [Pseudomonas lundensis]